MSEQGGTELARFLRARRALVRPEDVGLPTGTGLRRTPGLRREELATLAGVSIDYYTRMERGREHHPSPAVVDALAGVLRLNVDEREHLHGLAAQSTRRAAAPGPTREPSRAVRPGVRQLLESLRPNPAYVVGRTNDLLAANPPGLRLLHGIDEWPVARRNLTRFLFLHPAARELYADWDTVLPPSVAHLRAIAGTDPDVPGLAALVGELVVKSPEFARLWNRYEVCERSAGHKRFRHPEVGELTLGYEVMELTRTDGQRLVAFHATPGGPDHDAAVLLDLAGTGEQPRTDRHERDLHG
ncbi:helix-turn-helix transcriptional regulator [Embleya sp. AB8]|uniref:helix-turn-helix transcriptional regulator n=1 Tax=Embleya sp. AB8 TaxID=3156304 RepID=UPI003C732605